MDLDEMAGTYEALCAAAQYHAAEGQQALADAEMESAAKLADAFVGEHLEADDGG